jgi:deoxycytidine triphosphate deaminase
MLRRGRNKDEKAEDFLRMRERDLRLDEERKAREQSPNHTSDTQNQNDGRRFIPWTQRNDIDLTDVD